MPSATADEKRMRNSRGSCPGSSEGPHHPAGQARPPGKIFARLPPGHAVGIVHGQQETAALQFFRCRPKKRDVPPCVPQAIRPLAKNPPYRAAVPHRPGEEHTACSHHVTAAGYPQAGCLRRVPGTRSDAGFPHDRGRTGCASRFRPVQRRRLSSLVGRALPTRLSVSPPMRLTACGERSSVRTGSHWK